MASFSIKMYAGSKNQGSFRGSDDTKGSHLLCLFGGLPVISGSPILGGMPS